MENISGEQAAKIYSSLYGYNVPLKEMKDERVHHPLGQLFWTKDEVSLADFEKYLAETLRRQVSASEMNDAISAVMLSRKASVDPDRHAADGTGPMGW